MVSMFLRAILCFLFVINHQIQFCLVAGHGRLIEPPARNYAWRLAEFAGSYDPYYDDNELDCGGRQIQWEVHGGKCGVCGDENGISSPLFVFPGKYAKNIITRTYTQGQQIQVQVEITANHLGWFEFRLGDIGNPPITQAKLTHLLQLVSGGTRYQLNNRTGVYTINLQLPPGLTCAQCVLQWWYNTGNHWGCDSPDNCAVGLGPQESFVNCADIKILSSTDSVTASTTQATTKETTIRPDETITAEETLTPAPEPTPSKTTQPITEEPTTDPCKGVFNEQGTKLNHNYYYYYYHYYNYYYYYCYKSCKNGGCPTRLCQCLTSFF